MIERISHITFIVEDLERTSKIFDYIFEGELIYSSRAKEFSLSKEKFYLIGNQWIVIMQGEKLANKTYNHIAFKINEKDFDLYKSRVKDLGLELKQSRSRIKGEGQSLYFYDYDNHLFELHTGTLNERLKQYLKHQNS